MTGQTTFGASVDDRLTSASFNRYLLPAYCLLLLPAATFFQREPGVLRTLLAILLFTFINVSSSWLSTHNTSNLRWSIIAQQQTAATRSELLSLIPPESVVLGCSLNYYLVDTGRPIIDCPRGSNVRYGEEVARVVDELLENGESVYVVGDYTPDFALASFATTKVGGQSIDVYRLSQRLK